MDKKTFQILIIDPLNIEFNTTIYLNGKLAQLKNLNIPRNCSGVTYTNRAKKPIVIIWQRNFYESLQTLFHELGHVVLHGKGSNFRGRYVIQEIEAETVALKTCELLKLPYNPNFKTSNDVNFIESYNRYKPKNANPRTELIDEIAQRIYKTLKDVKIS